jgi:hypothetical protein
LARPVALNVTPLMLDELARTKPWVRFFSVLGFIGSALMVLLGIALVVMSALGPLAPGLEGIGKGLALSLVYLVMAAIYIAPAVYLHRYAAAIGDLLGRGGEAAMERALAAQRTFWRFTGIVAVAIMVVYGLVLIGLLGFMSLAAFAS